MPIPDLSQHRPARGAPAGRRAPHGGGDRPVVRSASDLASGSASGSHPEAVRDPNPQHVREVPLPAGSATGARFRSCSAAGAPVPPTAVPLAPAAA
jgi:hypothetical protein